MRAAIAVLMLAVGSLFAFGQATTPQNPTLKVAVAPGYPPLAVAARVSGVVRVQVTVDASGAVTRTEVTEGHPMLKKTAADAAHEWKFDGSSEHERTATLSFDFVLLPEKATLESQTSFLPPYAVEVKKRPAPSTVNYDGKAKK